MNYEALYPQELLVQAVEGSLALDEKGSNIYSGRLQTEGFGVAPTDALEQLRWWFLPSMAHGGPVRDHTPVHRFTDGKWMCKDCGFEGPDGELEQIQGDCPGSLELEDDVTAEIELPPEVQDLPDAWAMDEVAPAAPPVKLRPNCYTCGTAGPFTELECGRCIAKAPRRKLGMH